MSPTFLILACVLVCGGVFLAGAQEHVGCYEDSEANPALKGPITSSSSMEPKFCASKCLSGSYPFAGVKGDKCICGNEVKNQKSDGCSTSCPGAPMTICGGNSKISIYKTGIDPSKKSS